MITPLMGAPASAADLGGDCCADLEERVAELEATTARKGNRKVSLTVSGWVNQAVFFWDDGVESNQYVGTNDLEQDRFRFVGDAKIVDGWNAGYILEIGLNGADSKTFSQDSDGTGNNLQLRKTAWFIKSKDLGKVTVGRFDTATYHLIDNIDTLLTRNVSDYEAAGVALGAFRLRHNGSFIGTTTWLNVMGGHQNGSPGQTGLRNVVRYDTPTIANFTGVASWGEDDQWEIALKYVGDIGDFKVNGAVGYGESTDPGTNGAQCAVGTGDCQWWGIGGLVQHTPTGIYVYGGYGAQTADLKAAQAGKDDESRTWYVQAGVERKWFDLGKTNVFGEYRNDDVGLTSKADQSDLDFWATGVVQNIENADMSLYAVYRHYQGDIVLAGATTTTSLDDFDVLISGAKINFRRCSQPEHALRLDSLRCLDRASPRRFPDRRIFDMRSPEEALGDARMTAPTGPDAAEQAAPWCRAVLIAAALIETLGAINDLPLLFGDTSEVPGPGLGGWIIAAKIALAPVAAIAALVFAARAQIPKALIAMAVVILLTWLSYMPSVAIHGIDFEGSVAVVLQMVFRIMLAPFLAVQVIALAARNKRIEVATVLAVLPTLLNVLGIAAFAIGVAISGF